MADPTPSKATPKAKRIRTLTPKQKQLQESLERKQTKLTPKRGQNDIDAKEPNVKSTPVQDENNVMDGDSFAIEDPERAHNTPKRNRKSLPTTDAAPVVEIEEKSLDKNEVGQVDEIEDEIEGSPVKQQKASLIDQRPIVILQQIKHPSIKKKEKTVQIKNVTAKALIEDIPFRSQGVNQISTVKYYLSSTSQKCYQLPLDSDVEDQNEESGTVKGRVKLTGKRSDKDVMDEMEALFNTTESDNNEEEEKGNVFVIKAKNHKTQFNY